MPIGDLLTIDPSKKCLKFLHDRILSDNYRGLQLSQHNRYTYDQVVGMLKIFYDLAGTERMEIRTTDLSKRPANLPNEAKYAEYTHLVNMRYGKSTQDSIRKNLFVDFHRMGLLSRYNANGISLGAYERGKICAVSLTNLALELIDETKTILERHIIFSRCLDNILWGMVTDMIDVLRKLDNLTVDEYTFFISFAHQQLHGIRYELEALIEYANEYHGLPRAVKNHITAIIKDYCNPDNFGGNKIAKRDYHNWRNEAQQVFMLLDMTVYFEYDAAQEHMKLMIKHDSIFTSQADITKLKRSYGEKAKYFTSHSVSKILGFELHHIIPLLWANSADQFFILDKWQNMLYIDGGKHSYISQSGNVHIKLDFDNDNIILSDTFNDCVKLDYGTNVMYGIANKQVMADTNADLLASFK